MQWIYILTFYCLQYSNCLLLPCSSKQENQENPVTCTATRYINENCSDDYLSVLYPDLYGQTYWPDKPHDLQLIPIQEEYKNSNKFLPGFQAVVAPPRSSSIQTVRGFQLDFEEEANKLRKCVIVKIDNTPLNSEHRDRNLALIVKFYPMAGEQSFIFTSWSLPKPRPGENNTYLVRYGKTGKYGWGLTDAPGDWTTTISHYNNLQEKYIRVWFVPAPEEYHFQMYTVTLCKIIQGEGANEKREPVHRQNTSTTEYNFLNVSPGKYRVLVQPYDDKWNTFDEFKCKDNEGGHVQCAVTKTAVINVPDDGTSPETSTSILTPPEDVNPSQHIFTSVFGFVTFILVIVIIVGCYKLYKDTGKYTGTVNEIEAVKGPIVPEIPGSPNCPGESNIVALISTEDDESQTKVVYSLASFLKNVCHLHLLFYPWTSNKDKYRWIANTIEKSDFIVLVISQSALNQYEKWIYDNTSTPSTLYMNVLRKVLNLSIKNPNFSEKLILVKFSYTENISIPTSLSCMTQYVLPENLSEFLYHVIPFDDSLNPVPLTSFHCLNETQEARGLSSAIRNATRKLHNMDSGYYEPDRLSQGSVKSAVTVGRGDFNQYNYESEFEFYAPSEVDYDLSGSALQLGISQLNERNISHPDGYSV